MALPCRCAGPNPDCRRAGRPMDAALWGICSGRGCSPDLSEQYRALWDGWADGTIPRLGKRIATPAPIRPADCIYLGTAPLERTDAAGVACECAGKWLFPCDLFGACRVNDDRGPAVCCQGCEKYVSDRLPPV